MSDYLSQLKNTQSTGNAGCGSNRINNKPNIFVQQILYTIVLSQLSQFTFTCSSS